ncbi:GNAT family N-acetyltransferase [Candidatus Gracilibacteria bacterium]|nr:GNAT family N-acetyltransferase [Candidatus Gracilibacteria bacterium]
MMEQITITREDAGSADAATLVDELDALLIPMYPIESHHGYTVAQLIERGVAFFVLRVDGAAAACGGVQIYGDEYGEIKRMFVRPSYRGLGLAKRMLQHLEGYTLAQGVATLRLETGILQNEAIGLYERLGYTRIAPFGAYCADPLSLFFEKQLAETTA